MLLPQSLILNGTIRNNEFNAPIQPTLRSHACPPKCCEEGFTDIVGYNALMGEDEQKAFELLNRNRNLQKPLIEKHNGKWIKELVMEYWRTFQLQQML